MKTKDTLNWKKKRPTADIGCRRKYDFIKALLFHNEIDNFVVFHKHLKQKFRNKLSNLAEWNMCPPIQT